MSSVATKIWWYCCFLGADAFYLPIFSRLYYIASLLREGERKVLLDTRHLKFMKLWKHEGKHTKNIILPIMLCIYICKKKPTKAARTVDTVKYLFIWKALLYACLASQNKKEKAKSTRQHVLLDQYNLYLASYATLVVTPSWIHCFLFIFFWKRPLYSTVQYSIDFWLVQTSLKSGVQRVMHDYCTVCKWDEELAIIFLLWESSSSMNSRIAHNQNKR